jgi:hypothetical protein
MTDRDEIERRNETGPIRLWRILPRLGVGLAIIVVLSLLTFPSKTFYSFDFEIGDVADNDVISPIKYPVPKTAAELEAEIQSRRSEVRPIYIYTDELLREGWQEFRRLLADLRAALEAESLPGEKRTELAQSLSGRYRVDFTPELLALLRDEPELLTELQKLPDTLESAFVNGVVEDKTDMDEGVLVNGLLLRYPEEDLYFARAYEQIADLGQIRERVLGLIAPYLENEELTRNLVDVVARFIQPTIYLDEEATAERIAAAEGGVDRVSYWVSENERIVAAHEVITPEVYRKLKALESFRSSRGILYVTLGRAAIITVFLFIFTLFLYTYRRRYFNSLRYWILSGLILILVVGLSQLIITFFFQQVPQIGYLLPAALAGVLFTILLDTETAIVGSLVASVMLGLLTGLEVRYLFVFLTAGLAAVFSATNLRTRSSLYWITLKVAAAKLLVIAAIGLSFSDTLPETLNNAVLGAVGSLISVFIASLVLPIFESLFHITTPVQLLELSDVNHPLLRRLNERAPGTYFHSLNVGVLAEAAAGTVGANALLAKVGAYYHDIGKIDKPDYFSENIRGESKHDSLSPSMSSLVIRSHVKNGVELARKHRLPRGVIQIIREHHGTGLISFFYQQALQLDEHNILEKKDFRYPGPLPRSKEAAIVMLADSVESASRTITNTTVSSIRILVRNVVNSKFVDGQLSACDLTLNDLSTISESFVKTLTGLLHSRIEYPDELVSRPPALPDTDTESDEESA